MYFFQNGESKRSPLKRRFLLDFSESQHHTNVPTWLEKKPRRKYRQTTIIVYKFDHLATKKNPTPLLLPLPPPPLLSLLPPSLPPAPLPSQFQLDEGTGTRRDFQLACPTAMLATVACGVLPERWFPPHFGVRTDFPVTAWDVTVEMARVYSPTRLACWVHRSDRSRRYSSDSVRNIWDVCIRGLNFVLTYGMQH